MPCSKASGIQNVIVGVGQISKAGLRKCTVTDDASNFEGLVLHGFCSDCSKMNSTVEFRDQCTFLFRQHSGTPINLHCCSVYIVKCNQAEA